MSKKKKENPIAAKDEKYKPEGPAEKSLKDVPAEAADGDSPMITFIYSAFVAMGLFFAWSGYTAYVQGNFSQFLMLGFAFGGFLIAMLSKQLQKSGYFFMYRVLAVLFFVVIAVMYFFVTSLDGFLTAILCILGFALMLAAVLPFFAKEIPVQKVAMISLGFVAAGLTFMLLVGTSTEVRRQKTISFSEIFPFGLSFDPDGRHVWVYGDNRFFIPEAGKTARFSIMRREHPDQYLVGLARKEMENIEKLSGTHKNGKDKKAGVTAPVEDGHDVFFEGKRFSWSASRDGQAIAVAIEKDAPEKNGLYVVNLSDRKRTLLASGQDRQYFFPWKSRTFPAYTTWSRDGGRFFVFTRDGAGKTGLLTVDAAGQKVQDVAADGVLSAFWGTDGRLYVLSGQKNPPPLQGRNDKEKEGEMGFLQGVHYGMFDWEPREAALLRWSDEKGSLEDVEKLPGGIRQVMVHPLSGKVLAFDGARVQVLSPGGEKPQPRDFAFVPNPDSSGISDDGTMILFKGEKAVMIASLESGQAEEIEKTSDLVRHVTFTRDGSMALYNTCSRYNPMAFRVMLKVFSLKDKKLSRVITNLLTASDRASIRIPYAYFSDPASGQVFFDERDIKKSLTNSENLVSLWILFPRVVKLSEIKPSPSPSLSPSPSPSPSLSTSLPPSPSPLAGEGAAPSPDSSPVGSPAPVPVPTSD